MLLDTKENNQFKQDESNNGLEKAFKSIAPSHYKERAFVS